MTRFSGFNVIPISERASLKLLLLDSASAAKGAASLPFEKGSGPHPGIIIFVMSSAKIVKPTSVEVPSISMASAYCREEVRER